MELFPAMRDDPPSPGSARDVPAVDRQASAWLARRDRGLSPQEQDEYLEWLRNDPRRRPAIARVQKTWAALDALAERRPALNAHPNPDLLAQTELRSQSRPRWPVQWVLLTAAALVLVGIFLLQREDASPLPVAVASATPARAAVHVISAPEQTVLDDGSRVTVNGGGAFEVRFTASERRVRLVRGEAHFAVTHDSARPFVVEAGKVSVRAIGTAFDVMLAADAVEVLVTEGKVQVEEATAAFTPTSVIAGERAFVDTTSPTTAPVVTAVVTADFEQTLAWQHVRIEFRDLPLREVVSELNLRNRQQLEVGDAETGQMLVGGTFRADNVDAFVRLLELSFGVIAERRDDGTTVLRRAK